MMLGARTKSIIRRLDSKMWAEPVCEPLVSHSKLVKRDAAGAGRALKAPDKWRHPRRSIGRQLLLVLMLCKFTQSAATAEASMASVGVQEAEDESSSSARVRVKIGALLEESDHEQVNMFIRTIKMINERKDETIRQLLNISSSAQRPQGADNGATDEDANAPDVGSSAGSPLGALPSGAGKSKQHQQAALRVKLEPMIEFLADKQSSFEADVKVCQLIESGVRAILGPTDGVSINHVQSICDNLEVPYFELRPFVGGSSGAPEGAALSANNAAPAAGNATSDQLAVPAASGASSGMRGDQDLHSVPPTPSNVQAHPQHPQHPQQPNRLEDQTLNLYPPTHLLTSAYIDLIYAWNWTSFAIVYEDGNSMIKLQDLFKESSGSWTSKWQIRLFQFNADSGAVSVQTINSTISEQLEQQHSWPATNDASHHINGKHHRSRRKATFRDIFWRIKLSGEQNILLDVKTENLYEALKQAQQVGCMTERFSYLVTSLDLHTIDLEDFKYSRTRITSFNLIQVARFQQPAYLQDSSSSAKRRLDARSKSFLDQSASISRGDAIFSLPLDEKYLEKLGVHVIQSDSGEDVDQRGKLFSLSTRSQSGSSQDHYQDQHQSNGNSNSKHSNGNGNRLQKYKLSPSIVLDRTGAFMDPPSDVYKDWPRRADQFLSSSLPAANSIGILPKVNRDNEQRLFEFLIDQQERNLSRVHLSTPSAILHDSLILYTLALNELDPQGLLLFKQDQQITCSLNSQPWLHGSSLVNYMRRISFNGLTGPISFDQRGLRSDFKLDMMGVAPDIGLIKVGEWHSNKKSQLNKGSKQRLKEDKKATQNEDDEAVPAIIRSYDEISEQYERDLRRYKKMLINGEKVAVPYNKRVSKDEALIVNEIIFERLYREQTDEIDTLIVTTKLSQPYFMLKETPNKLEGNDQYEGFAVDLVHELSKLVNFKYRWKQVADRKYGSKEVLPNGTVVWNGMIGEIVRNQADLAIVDLTITAQREEAVDFTLPFMNTGISILFKKPTTKVTTLFSFLSPFSSDVWAYVLAAYCGISAVLFFVGHLSPYEWSNPHPCRHTSSDGEDIGVLKNQFSLLNSFWFTIGSLMQQGSDLTPRSMSTRTIAGIWYFFTLIMISSYTANLAAFLTVEKVVYPIENVRDLSNQQEIKYGCVESGSTCTFFHDSQIDTYKRINETMRKFKTYVRSNDEGQKRVEEGKFAFFMESASIEYIVERNCNLTQIGGLLDSKGYGMATSKRSRLKRPYRTLLSEGILHLQETGMLHILKNRWWKERRGGGTCTDDGKGGGVTELSLANVGGVFVVLLGGLGISFLVAIAEFMWRARRSGSTRDRMCDEMMSDLKFALACKRSTKPVQPKPGQLSRKQRLVAQASTSSQLIDASRQSQEKCDPVLLQAMLTMLAQQRQQQQQQQQQQDTYLMTNVNYPNTNSTRTLASGRQSENNASSFNHSPMAVDSKNALITSEQLSLLNDQVYAHSSNQAEPHQHHLQSGRSSKAGKRTSEAGKRRLLFSQQTIGTGDESFLARQVD